MDLLKKLRYIFTRQQKIKFMILFGIMFVGAIFELMGVSLILPFVQVVMDPNSIQQNSIMKFIYDYLNIQSTNDFLLLLSIVLIIVYIVKNIYLLAMYYAQYTFTYNNQIRMSVRILDCYLKKPYTFHLQKNTAEIVRSVTTDVINLFQLVINFLQLIAEILVATMLGIFLLITDVFITVAVVVLLGMCTSIFFGVFRKKLKSSGDDTQKYYGQMIKWINQSLGGIKEIKISHREQFFVDSYTEDGIKYTASQKNYFFLNQTPKLLIEAVCVVGMLIVVSIMLYIGKDVTNLIPQLAVFAMAAFRLLPSVNRMNNNINTILFFKPSIDLIYNDLLQTQLDNKMDMKINKKKVKKEEIKKDINKTEQSIKISNLSFKYPNTDKYVLKDVNFDVPIGKSTAFIGPSGAGKTTMADIILGLIKPESGEILADNLSIYDNPEIWSQKLGYIPQTIYLSDDTIRNNIAFGIESEQINEDAIWDSLEQAQLKEFVESQPYKLDTHIGERGVRLSGGQRQRIGIARALYHNPEILILDEATSSLDNETEEAVMEAIDNLQGKKTMIIIAHRLTTIKNCDLIYEIKDNKVKEVEK